MMEGKAATRSTKKYLTTKETLTNGRHKVTLAYEYTEEFREFRRGRWIDIRDLTKTGRGSEEEDTAPNR